MQSSSQSIFVNDSTSPYMQILRFLIKKIFSEDEACSRGRMMKSSNCILYCGLHWVMRFSKSFAVFVMSFVTGIQ